MPVIMGRKTFESMGKPLTGRTNIVITRQPGWSANEVKVAQRLDEALNHAANTDAKEAFVIGGGEIFNQCLPLAHKIYFTRVHAVIEGDVFFPSINEKEWKLVSKLDFNADEKHAFAYTFEVWERM